MQREQEKMALGERAETLIAEVKSFEERKSALNMEIASTEREIQELSGEINRKKEKIEGLKKKNSSWKFWERGKNEQMYEEIQASIRSTDDRLRELQDVLEDHKLNMGAINVDIENRRLELDQVESKLAA
jgi:chromosome segregation ATPase